MGASARSNMPAKYVSVLKPSAPPTTGPESFHCLELFRVPPGLAVPDGDETNGLECPREKALQSLMKHSKGPFAVDALADKAPITAFEEATVIIYLSIVMGGPLVWFMMVTPYVLFFGSWLQFAILIASTLALALHPLPTVDYKWLRMSFVAQALYKYFSYRFVWSGQALEKVRTCGPWLGAGVPHGVLPFANLLCMLGINSFMPGALPFIAAPATVVFRTPFLRYLLLLGPSCEVGAKSLSRELAAGNTIGLVPDGIAGIFRCTTDDETIYLKNRKGLAKLALKTGTSIIPAYSLGNTEAFSAWFDPFGLMESLSRKAQASVFFYWGRFGLPIPHRTPITMLFGDPVSVAQKIPDPTAEQIDEVHQKLLDGIEDVFNKHKASLGWGHKKIQFV